MAKKIKATPQKEEVQEEDVSETPLLDLFDAAVTAAIRSAKKRGYITRDQINALLGEVRAEQIENLLTNLSDMGINAVETTEAEFGEEVATGEELEEEAEDENALVEVQQRAVPSKAATKDPSARTDDPVRIYLRDMGSKELLSREGEIKLAKR